MCTCDQRKEKGRQVIHGFFFWDIDDLIAVNGYNYGLPEANP
jgi:hypothetical protein